MSRACCHSLPQLLAKWLVFSLLMALLGLWSLGLWAPGFAASAERGNRQVVVFSANWCASCRHVVPVVEQVARQLGLSVETIDVDSASAPSHLKSLGLSMPTGSPPVVYYLNGTSSKLILDAKTARGLEDAALQSLLLDNLR